jgi:hypothetical protein
MSETWSARSSTQSSLGNVSARSSQLLMSCQTFGIDGVAIGTGCKQHVHHWPLERGHHPDPSLPVDPNDGTIPPVSQQQRLAIVIQATRDVFATPFSKSTAAASLTTPCGIARMR